MLFCGLRLVAFKFVQHLPERENASVESLLCSECNIYSYYQDCLKYFFYGTVVILEGSEFLP